MSSGGVVGSAFVEVHARASSQLEAEAAKTGNAAAQRAQLEATRVEKAGTSERMRAADYFAERKRIAALAASESEVEAVRKVEAVEKSRFANLRRDLGQARSGLGAIGGTEASKALGGLTTLLNPTALGLAAVGAAAGLAFGGLKKFLDAGAAGTLTSADQVRSYRETAVALEQLSESWDRAQLAVGRYVAKNVNPASSDFKKGIESLRHPLATLSVHLGITTDGTRRLGEAFAKIDAAQPKKSLAEIERAAKATATAHKEAISAMDARVEATIRAVGAEFELVAAGDRVAAAQEKVNAANAKGAETAKRLADAERAVHEAREAAADAAQKAVESDRTVAEARRNLNEARFRSGTGSQAAIDAADALQEAEFAATRAHEEAGDAVADVAKAERDAADVRIKAVDDQKQAQKELDDALRASAKAHADFRVAQLEASGVTGTATDKLRIYKEELAKFASTGGPSVRAELDLIAKAFDGLSKIPTPAWFGRSAESLFNDAINAATSVTPTASNVTTSTTTAPVQIVQNETVDPLHTAAEIAWRRAI